MNQFQRRKSIRHATHDYTQPGFYFFTICTYEKEKIFGEIFEKAMRHSVAGNIVLKCWEQLPSFFESILLDAFTVMPNHIHGIVQLKEGNRNALGQIVRNFKSICTRKIRKYTQIEAIWQDNYFERVIRSERELNLIRLYIDLNPLMWDENKKMYQLEFRSEEELEELLKSYRESNL